MSDTEHTSWTPWQTNEVINASDLSRYEGLKVMIDSANTSIAEHDEQIVNINTDITSIKSDISSLSSSLTDTINTLSSTVIDLLYPIGSLYFTANTLFDPNDEWTGTKWIRFAKGRTIFGVADSGTFNGNGLTGGNETHTLISSELPPHVHSFDNTLYDYTQTTSAKFGSGKAQANRVQTISSFSSFEDTELSTIEALPFSILPPYITTYIWKRIPLTYIFTEAPGLQYDDTTNVISWSYAASSGVTIEYAVNNSEYSTVMPTYIYDENDTDVVFYIKGSLDDYSEITSASLPAHVST